jgi:hypothetical protein
MERAIRETVDGRHEEPVMLEPLQKPALAVIVQVTGGTTRETKAHREWFGR